MEVRIMVGSRNALCGSVAIALLTACRGSSLPFATAAGIPQVPMPSLSEPYTRIVSSSSGYKVSKGLLYVAMYDPFSLYDDVKIYDTNVNDPSPMAEINAGVSQPQDACMDKQGTLYVTNQGSGNGTVSEYRLGETTPSRIITQGMDTPAFCAIDREDDLWVTNISAPNVTEYKKGSVVPYTTITNGIIYPVGVAIDHSGNIFVVNHQLYGTTNVVVYPPGQKSPSRTITGMQWPVGIAVDEDGTLYVPDWYSNDILKYRRGDGRPYQRITKVNYPVAVTINRKGWLYVTNAGQADKKGYGPAPAIVEFSPSSRRPSGKDITTDVYTPLGTAYYPPMLP